MSPHQPPQVPSSNNPLHGIINWFANNSVAANLLLISVIVMGIMSLSTLRKEAFPSLEPDTVSVSVVYDSGDALQAEEGIALKIEEALETVQGIKRITSTSDASGSHVSIEKETDYSLDELLFDVKNQVDAINNFPVDAEQPVIDKARRQDHALTLQLFGDADRHTLQNLGEKLKADLLAQSGISDVTQSGVLDPMMSVEIDEGKLQAYGLTISDISEVINNESSSPLSTSLRNAYQHTQQGQVRITQQGSRVIIVNRSAQIETPHVTNSANKPTNIGYGLGLELSEKIIKRHGWVYEVSDMPGRYEVVVDFS